MKLTRSLSGQRGAGDRWTVWSRTARLNPFRVWVHAASVGEGLLADPVLARLANIRGAPMSAIRTFTSPSTEGRAGSYRYDRSDYLPHGRASARLLATIKPDLILYPRGDLWPSLVRLASKGGIPQVIIGGTLRPDSRRLRWPGRAITGKMVRKIDWIGAVTHADATRWKKLGAPSGRITITGDPRDDQVLERDADFSLAHKVRQWAGSEFVLLAGSTHASDEKHLIPAVANMAGRAIVVPHEPSNTAVRHLVSLCEQHGVTYTVTESDNDPVQQAKLLIVNVTGALQDLYAAVSVAFVGGGFDGTRLHSVAEPASFGLPILFGPGGRSDPTTAAFLTSDAARVVTNSQEITNACSALQDRDSAATVGLKARATLDAGAASKTVELLRRLLSDERR